MKKPAKPIRTLPPTNVAAWRDGRAAAVWDSRRAGDRLGRVFQGKEAAPEG